ncbi:hypothetical protein WJ23_20730 [Burkholderia lata]|nr:hypothetical protein WJ23_20730 [Burkholderia lata]
MRGTGATSAQARVRATHAVVERARRAADQVGEAVAQQYDLLVELRQLRADLCESCVRAAHIEVARQPVRGGIADVDGNRQRLHAIGAHFARCIVQRPRIAREQRDIRAASRKGVGGCTANAGARA